MTLFSSFRSLPGYFQPINETPSDHAPRVRSPRKIRFADEEGRCIEMGPSPSYQNLLMRQNIETTEGRATICLVPYRNSPQIGHSTLPLSASPPPLTPERFTYHQKEQTPAMSEARLVLRKFFNSLATRTAPAAPVQVTNETPTASPETASPPIIPASPNWWCWA